MSLRLRSPLAAIAVAGLLFAPTMGANIAYANDTATEETTSQVAAPSSEDQAKATAEKKAQEEATAEKAEATPSPDPSPEESTPSPTTQVEPKAKAKVAIQATEEVAYDPVETYFTAVKDFEAGHLRIRLTADSPTLKLEWATATGSNSVTVDSGDYQDIPFTGEKLVVTISVYDDSSNVTTVTMEAVEPDTDGDGYTDAEERAAGSDPNDPKSTPADLDGDGVPNGDDAFPNDPNESKDSDGDGIGDNADKCANTPVGTVVNADGCSAEQLGDKPDAVFPQDPKYNNASYWETYFGDGAYCIKYDPASTPFTVPSAPAGYSWFSAIVKAGAGDAANELYNGIQPGDKLVHSSGKNISHVILCKQKTPKPAEPTVTASCETCANHGQADGAVKVTVTNTADSTKATVEYTVTVAGVSKKVTIKDGESGVVQFDGLRAGNYTVKVSGSDKTCAETSVTVKECPKPPKPEGAIDFTKSCEAVQLNAPKGVKPEGAEYVYKIDGKPAVIGVQIPLTPGEHIVTLWVNGEKVDWQKVVIEKCPVVIPPAGESNFTYTCKALTVKAPQGVKPEGAEYVSKLDGVEVSVGNHPITAGQHTLTLWVNGVQVDSDTFTVDKCPTVDTPAAYVFNQQCVVTGTGASLVEGSVSFSSVKGVKVTVYKNDVVVPSEQWSSLQPGSYQTKFEIEDVASDTTFTNGETVIWSAFDINPAGECTKKVTVAAPILTSPTCTKNGVVSAEDGPFNTWVTSGPDSAKVYTAVLTPEAKEQGVTLVGQTSWTFDLTKLTGEQCDTDDGENPGIPQGPGADGDLDPLTGMGILGLVVATATAYLSRKR